MRLWHKIEGIRTQPLKPDVIYLVLALVFGLAFVFLNPPCGTPDEPAHLLRVFRIAQGGFYHAIPVRVPPLDHYCQLCDDVGAANFPSYLQPDMKKFLHEPAPLHFEEESTSSYPPVPYLPAALMFKLLSWFHPALATSLYLGRLATFLASLLITWYAIKVIPTGKWIMVVLALMPMRLYQMASISADSVTTALASLWIALVLALLLTNRERLGKRLLFVMATAVLLAFSKPMYAFLLLLVLAVPFKGYGKYAAAVKFAVILILLLAGIKLYRFAAHYVVSSEYKKPVVQGAAVSGATSAFEMTSDPFFLGRVDEKAQAALLLREPTRIYFVLKHGYQQLGKVIARGTIGDMGWLNVALPNLTIQCAILLMVLSLGMHGYFAPGIRFRVTALSVFLIMLLVIPLGLYLSWTPVGGDVFLGVSGRYFIPLLPLAFLAVGVSISGTRFLFWTERLVIIGLAGCLLSSLVALWNTYYAVPPTAGVLRLTARSSANGIAMFATSTSEGKMQVRGRYNLIDSETPLQYEFRLPAGPIKIAYLSINSPPPVRFGIQRAEILRLDGTLLKQIDLQQVKLATPAADGSLSFTKAAAPVEVIVDKQRHTVVFDELDLMLTNNK